MISGVSSRVGRGNSECSDCFGTSAENQECARVLSVEGQQSVIFSRKNFIWRQSELLRVRTPSTQPSVLLHYIFFVNEPKTRTLRISLRDDSQIKNHLRNYIPMARLGEHCQLHVLWITCGRSVAHSRTPNLQVRAQ